MSLCYVITSYTNTLKNKNIYLGNLVSNFHKVKYFSINFPTANKVREARTVSKISNFLIALYVCLGRWCKLEEYLLKEKM